MGYMRHHAIVVTGYAGNDKDSAAFKLLRDRLSELAAASEDMTHKVTEVTKPAMNGFASFLIAPDGSKEGWRTSNRGDAYRDAAIAILENGHIADWVEVQFCDDNGVNRITRQG
jgi:hypothetical protein